MGIAFPAKEVIKEMRQLIRTGSKPLYRHSNDPARLFTEGFKDYTHSTPKVNTGVEPLGLYFADKMNEIEPLLQPNIWRTPLIELKNDYGFSKAIPGDLRFKRGIISGVLSPDARIKNFSEPEWQDFVTGLLREKNLEGIKWSSNAGKFRLDTANLPDGVIGEALPLAKTLTSRLANAGYDAVRFPDLVADQKDLFQTTLLSRGNMLAKWRKGAETGAGILGVGGLALPNFLDKEQTS